MGANAVQSLAIIKLRFAGREPAVERLHRECESFRGLCRDYLACAAALARWQESSSQEAPSRAQEYSALLNELEAEIETQLRAGERLGHPPLPGEVGRS